MIVGLVACASTGGAGGSARSACALADRDSAYLERGPVYRDCAVDNKAKLLTTNVTPKFQPSSSDRGCLAAEIQFVVDTMGIPESGSTRLIRATTQTWGEAVASMVPSLLYEPARLSGRKVRQIVTSKYTAMLSAVVVPMGSTPTRSGAQRVPNC